eukprot:4487544-Prymnesium_polylepis.1
MSAGLQLMLSTPRLPPAATTEARAAAQPGLSGTGVAGAVAGDAAQRASVLATASGGMPARQPLSPTRMVTSVEWSSCAARQRDKASRSRPSLAAPSTSCWALTADRPAT